MGEQALTPEERAKRRYPKPIVTDTGYLNLRIGYAAAIRELVEPAEKLASEMEQNWVAADGAACEFAERLAKSDERLAELEDKLYPKF